MKILSSVLDYLSGSAKIKEQAEKALNSHRENGKNLLTSMDKIFYNEQVLTALNIILEKAVTCETEEELARTCLDVAQEITEAKFGYFGELNKEGKFDTIAISNLGWSECEVSDLKTITQNMETSGMQFLSLHDGIARIFNDPASHPDSRGTPKGHPEVTCLLTVPLKYNGDVIGQIGLGNKEDGFNIADQEAVEELACAIVKAFRRIRDWDKT